LKGEYRVFFYALSVMPRQTIAPYTLLYYTPYFQL